MAAGGGFRQPRANLVAPGAVDRPSPPPAVAPTLGGGGGLSGAFRQPGQTMAPPTGEAIPQSEGGGVIGRNIEAANAPAPAAPPEVIRGTTMGAGDVHPSWQLYHNAGRGEDYPGAVASFRRSQGEGALRGQEAEANRATELEKTRMQGEAHVAASTAAARGPLYDAQKLVADEQAAELKREREAKVRGEVGTAADKYYKSLSGGSLPKENEPAYGDYFDARTHALAHPDQPDAFKQRYHENLNLRQYEPSFTTENLAKFGLTLPPNISQDAKRALMLEWGPKLLQQKQASAAQPTGDPAWDRLQAMDKEFKRSTTAGAEMFNRGVRNVVPGASMVITPQGQLQNPFKSAPGTPEIPYNPDPYVQ